MLSKIAATQVQFRLDGFAKLLWALRRLRAR